MVVADQSTRTTGRGMALIRQASDHVSASARVRDKRLPRGVGSREGADVR